VIPFGTFKELPKPTGDDIEFNPDFAQHKRRINEVYGGESSKFEHFMQVACGAKHSLLLNRRGQVFGFGNGLQGQLGINRRPMQQF